MEIRNWVDSSVCNLENCNRFKLGIMQLFSNLDATHCVFVTFADKPHCPNKKHMGAEWGGKTRSRATVWFCPWGSDSRRAKFMGGMWGGHWLEEGAIWGGSEG